MPQREPLSVPLLGALLVVAGLAAGWLVLALEAVAQGGAGASVGFAWQGIALQPPFGLPSVALGVAGTHGAWAWAACLLAGPAAALAVAFGGLFLVEAFGAPGWVRAIGFEAFALAWLRLPLLILAAGIPGGRGPLAALYDRLGEPESGRWAAIGLGLITLWGVCGLVAGKAVAVGRDWLRVDSLEFRRRLVRVVAGYPFLVATAAYALQRPLGPAGWLVAGLVLVVACLTLRTP